MAPFENACSDSTKSPFDGVPQYAVDCSSETGRDISNLKFTSLRAGVHSGDSFYSLQLTKLIADYNNSLAIEQRSDRSQFTIIGGNDASLISGIGDACSKVS